MARTHLTWTVLTAIVVFLGGLLIGWVAFRSPVATPSNLNTKNVNGNTNSVANSNSSSSTINANTNSSTNASGNTNTVTTKTYSNKTYGFQLTYPSNWTATENITGTGEAQVLGVTFGTTAKGVSLIAGPDSLTGIISETMSPHDGKTVTINGVEATRSIGASAKDGSRLDLLQFIHSGKVFLLNGSADLVDSVGATFTFTR